MIKAYYISRENAILKIILLQYKSIQNDTFYNKTPLKLKSLNGVICFMTSPVGHYFS